VATIHPSPAERIGKGVAALVFQLSYIRGRAWLTYRENGSIEAWIRVEEIFGSMVGKLRQRCIRMLSPIEDIARITQSFHQ